jgi:hypothetical protein
LHHARTEPGDIAGDHADADANGIACSRARMIRTTDRTFAPTTRRE